MCKHGTWNGTSNRINWWICCCWFIHIVGKRIKIDDPVGAIAAHGFTGAWGTIAVGLFAQEEFGGINGLLFGGGAGQLGAQFIGVIAAFVFVFGTSLAVFKLIDLTIGMRASDEEQKIGLDVTEHSASGYPDFTNVVEK